MDWQALLSDIMQHKGYTQTRIAQELRVSDTTIMRIRMGKTKEPSYSVGSRLISLYLKLKHEPG